MKEKERLLTPAPPEIVIKFRFFFSLSSRRITNFKTSLQTFHRPPEQEIETEIESNYIDNSQDNYIPSELFEHENKEEDEFYSGVTTEMLEMEVTTHHITTTTVETTTIPISESSRAFSSVH